MSIVRARELVDELTSAGIAATHRVSDLSPILPGVLVGPPAVDWTRGTLGGPLVTWSLRLVASTNDADQAWLELDALLAAVSDVLDVETATPVAFALSAEAPPLPAYTATLPETLED